MRTHPVSRAVIAFLTGAFAAMALPAVASADATDGVVAQLRERSSSTTEARDG
jgi:hypothetical protein